MGMLLAFWGAGARAQPYHSVVCAGDKGIAYYVTGWENSSFEWSVEGGTIDVDYGDSIIVNWPEIPGEYEITVREVSEWGCTGEVKRALVLVAGSAVELGDDAHICEGEVFEIVPEGDYSSYLWHDGSTEPGFETGSEGWIRVTVTDSYGCELSDSLYLWVHELPIVNLGPDTTICSQDGLVLDAGSSGEQYRWSTGEVSQRITVFNNGDQEIWVEVQNTYGCIASDTVLIRNCDLSHLIDIPTGITPNGDGMNDVWNIRRLSEFDQAVVEIFDQWGTLVWRSERGYSEPWDGTNMNGNPVPVDSYHFVIHFNDGSDERYVGYLTVIR